MERTDETKIQEYYKALGLQNGAGIIEITKSYRVLSKTLHPDKTDNFDAEAYYAIQLAYTELKEIQKEEQGDKLYKKENSQFPDFVQEFINKNIIKINKFDLKKSFYGAVFNDDLELMNQIINYGFNINHDFGQKNTILHMLVFFSKFNPKVLKFLFENKININQLNSNGESAFDILVDKRGDEKAISLFLNYGVNAQNCKKCKSIEIIKEYNANPISFVLKGQETADDALIAIKNLRSTKEYNVHDKKIEKTIQCLENLASNEDNALDSICGADATKAWYDPFVELFF